MRKLNNERLLSLDLFRGMTMLLLLAEGTHLFYFINGIAPQNTLLSKFAAQFLHAEWHGMHFWDLIQPFFTFITGISMSFSLYKRWERGEICESTLNHIMYRCAVLFILGITLQCVYCGRLVLELWNILTQLSVSIFIAFLIIRFPYRTQLIISFALLLLTEILYRYSLIAGFDQPFVKDYNFGAFVDLILMGKTNRDGWVAFNAIPTTAHVIWGALTGQVLLNVNNTAQRIKILVISCLLGLLIGYGLDWAGISPVNKKICTSSFVLVSGGWTLASFLFLYWLVVGEELFFLQRLV